MKPLEKWMAARASRQVQIWWHWRYSSPESGWKPKEGTSERYWHVELHEFEPLQDHGQKQQAGWWEKHESVFTGYDPSLAKAAQKALRIADKRPMTPRAGILRADRGVPSTPSETPKESSL